jgi:hypothetical protein
MDSSSPTLDDRSADEVLAQASSLAQTVYLSGLWTGFADPGDPAYQLLLVFGRLMEILLERLNQVPDKNFLAFLDMVGVEASPGAPAAVPMTFLPSAKAPQGGLVPAGTQTATTQTDQADAQIFETRQDIYVTASKLTAVVNLLPQSDLFSVMPAPVLPPALDPSGATLVAEAVALSAAVAGLVDVPHVLYLASTPLFGRKETLDVTLVLTVVGGDASLLDAANLLWRKLDKNSKTWVDLTPVYAPAPGGQIKVVLGSFANADQSTIAGQQDFWIACHFVGALPAAAAQPRLGAIAGTLAPAGAALSASEAPPLAFAGATPIDLARPFKPFGDRPRYGDAFYLSAARAFAPEVDSVTVTLTLKPYLTADLQRIFAGLTAATAPLVKIETIVEWQYLAGDGTWKPLISFQHDLAPGVGAPAPITQTLTNDHGHPPSEDGSFFGLPDAGVASFSFALPADLASGKVQGQDGLWIRALLTSDDPYGKEAFLVSGASLTAVGATLIPPVVKSAALSFTYKSTLVGMSRVVSDNNFQQLDGNQGGAAPIFPLQPFVAPADMTLGGGAAAAFGGDGALYLGFDQPFGEVYISLYVKLRDTFPSVDVPAEQGQPLVAWEYLAAGPLWKPLDVQDGTADLTSSGTVSFLGTGDLMAAALFGDPAVPGGPALCWLRARLASGDYDYPPALQGIFPNTVMADNQITAAGDVVIGSGSGDPGQEVTLLKTPVLAGELWVREPEPPPQTELDALVVELRGDTETNPLTAGSPVASAADVLDIRVPATPPSSNVTTPPPAREVWVRWRRVPNFLGSGPRSRHYALDPLSGLLLLGDGKQQGLLPPVAKDNLVIRHYRTGGGQTASQVAVPLAIKELKSSLPYVEKVFNVETATGGSDPWGLPEIFQFGPQLLKSKGRAVSAEDFEWMVLQQFSQVARAKCLSTRAPGAGGLVMKPGAVTVVVVPRSAERVPRPSGALLRQIADFLTEQCLASIVADVYALGPGFSQVTVHAQVRAQDVRQSSEVERRAAKALEDFFHPLTGGEDGQGWAFGRDVQLSEVFAVLQRVPGVDYVASAEFVGSPGVTALAIGDNDLVASGSHLIEMI